ncbi:MAG: cytochrome P450 [Saprospiraceae bacterium]|nr:cytochrome P450 [Saprospiraceae bacterium]
MRDQSIPKVSSIPVIGSTLKMIGKNPRDFLLKQYHRLGPIFRLNVMHLNYIVIAGEKANQFASGEGVHLLKSNAFWKGMLHELEADNFLIGLDGPEHVMLRKIFRHNFSKNNVDAHLQAINDLCIQTFEDIRVGDSFEVVERILQLTSQMIGCVVTGEVPTREELEYFLFYINSITNHFALNRLPAWLLKFRGARFKKSKTLTFDFAERVIEKHLTGSSNLNNFVDAVIDAARNKCPHLFEHGDIRFSAILPLFAGIDTLGQTINYALFELHKNPEILALLKEEIRAVWSNKIPSSAELKDLKVLNSVILETLRLHPAAFGMVRTANQDFEFEGALVKKGEDVVVLTTATHFMEDYFKNPTVFDIDRYRAPRNEHRQINAFAPFGKGPHSCLGSGLAEALMGLALGSILYHYEFEHLDPNLKIKERINPTPSLGSKFKLKIVSK